MLSTEPQQEGPATKLLLLVLLPLKAATPRSSEALPGVSVDMSLALYLAS